MAIQNIILMKKATLANFHWILLTPIFLIWWAFAPGHTNSDTIDIYNQARSGIINDWQTPAVSAIWAMAGAPPWIIALTFFTALAAFAFFTYNLFRFAGFSRPAASFSTTLTSFTPPVLGVLGSSCKDTWVAVLFIGIIYFTTSNQLRPHVLMAFLRCCLCVAAILVRPDFIVIVVLFLMLEVIAGTGPLWLRVRSLALNGVVVLGGYAAIDGLIRHVEHVAKTHPEQFIYLSDLTDLSVAQNRILIPHAFLENTDLSTIKKYYRYPDVSPDFWGGPPGEMIKFSKKEDQIAELRHEWLQQLEANPEQALKHRLGLFGSYLHAGAYYMAVVDANHFGISIYHKRADAYLLKYLSLFLHGPLQRHFISFLGCPVLILLLLKFSLIATSRDCLMVGLVCGFFYQVLFSILGLPPYWRFASAGVLIFWISAYIVAGYIVRAAVCDRRCGS